MASDGFVGGCLGLLIGIFAGLMFVPALAAVGFLVGGLFGERGINWIGALVLALEEVSDAPDVDCD